MPGEEDDREERRKRQEGRRLRSLLSSYYGVGNAEDAAAADPTNIDSPAFDADKYFEDLLKQSNLTELIHKDKEMVTEIKSLDGDMKSLVYENYNKFISATDTIRKMKSNVENMEAEMTRLSKDMQQITECSNKIDATLAPRQAKIEQLSGVHNLLQKLQFLVGLPSRLKKCIELEAYGQAVKYFTITTGILSQYNHLPSFKSIHQECEKIINDMRTKLREKICDPKTQPSEVSEVADYLIDLAEPIPSLRKLYLDSRRQALEMLLNTFETRENPNLVNSITDLSQMFLIELMYTLQSYRSLFMNRFDETKLNKKDKEESAKLLDEFSKDLFNKFLRVSNKLIGDSSPEDQIKGMEILTNEVMKINTKLPEVNAADKIGDIINGTVLKQISIYFTKLESTVQAQLQTVAVTLDKSSATDLQLFSQLCDTTSKMIIREMQETFEKVKMFFMKSGESHLLNDYYGVIFTKVEVQVQHVFWSLMDYLEREKDKRDSKLKPKEKAKFILLLVYICLYLEGKGLYQIMSLVQDIITSVRKSAPNADIQLNTLKAPEVAQQVRATAQKLLQYYVTMEGQRTGSMLRKGIEGMQHFGKKEPREVRLVVDLVVESITTSSREIESIFSLPSAQVQPQSATSSSGSQVRSSRSDSSASANIPKSSSVPSSMSSLFDKKVFGPLEFTAKSVLTGIVKIGLKTMLECVRLRTFGRNGYQQIQVDIHFIRITLWSLVGKNGPVDVLLSEIEQSVAERCTDPTPMEQSIIVKLCEDKLQKLGVGSQQQQQ